MGDFGFYFGLGWEHIISLDALDHQLFILVLAALYTFRDYKPHFCIGKIISIDGCSVP